MTIIFSEYSSDERAQNQSQLAIEQSLVNQIEQILTFHGSGQLKINVLSRGANGTPKLIFSGLDKTVLEARKRWDGRAKGVGAVPCVVTLATDRRAKTRYA